MNDYTQQPTIELLKIGLTKLGYSCESFKLGATDFTQFTAPSGQIWLTETAKVAYPFTSTSARRVSTNKDLAYDLAARVGAQVPFTATLNSREDNSAHYDELLKHGTLIVKPNSASLSRGLTLNITNSKMLSQAINEAGTFSDMVLVQKQLQGEEIRFIVVANKVKAALLRQTPRVIGDGQSTLKELLAAENEVRKAGGLQYPALTKKIIALDNFDLSIVLAVGEMIELGRGTMIARGASMYNVHSDVHPTYIAMAEKLAAAIGTGFVSVDVFINDYTQPLHDAEYAFIEYNMSPVLNLLYKCRDGNHYDILSDLVPLIDARINGGLL